MSGNICSWVTSCLCWSWRAHAGSSHGELSGGVAKQTDLGSITATTSRTAAVGNGLTTSNEHSLQIGSVNLETSETCSMCRDGECCSYSATFCCIDCSFSSNDCFAAISEVAETCFGCLSTCFTSGTQCLSEGAAAAVELGTSVLDGI